MVIKLFVKWLTFLICVVLQYSLTGMDFTLRSNPEHGHNGAAHKPSKIIMTRTAYTCESEALLVESSPALPKKEP